ncbi:hypothetical protein [Methylobacterium brachiatum]|uniref:hypothetical protein n=1 Tax=Methylobacterium brachiatum TaxID=269660 RepID=UPI0013CF3B83|nr:hypothetical protein [Methylobacterium brachiatum]
MVYFSICSNNFLAHSNALYNSIKQYHPDCRYYVVICDDVQNINLDQLDYEAIPMDKLGIPNLEEMISRYNITELNTALKPFALLYLFDKHNDEPIIYLDPDILVFSKMRELEEAFKDGAECILTPHICEPAEYAEMNDLKFLRYGIYNLGFCGFKGTEVVQRIVAWWARRLEKDCVIDLPEGLFVDQKWADLLPAFIEKTTIMRHPGYNVAYWNLSQRKVCRENDIWKVNNQELRFFHFSGHSMDETIRISRHCSQFDKENTSLVGELLDQYRMAVRNSGYSLYSTQKYSFNWFGERGTNEHAAVENVTASDRPQNDG